MSPNSLPASMIAYINFLGTFEIKYGSKKITDDVNRSHKLWGVLAYLIINRNRSIPLSEFIDTFWTNEELDNPQNALKAIIFRIRAMLQPVFGDAVDPIISLRGAYSWNRDIECVVDADVFESTCKIASDSSVSPKKRITFYKRACATFIGDFLPKISDQLWVVPLSVHYHELYLRSVKEYASLLIEDGQYEECGSICQSAARIDSLDDTVHTLIVRSLMLQGKDFAALSHYEMATEHLYQNLGVRPSESLRALYMELMRTTKSLETDLNVIQLDLKETSARPGAFVCDYGLFREVYRLEARRALRSGHCVHVALLTVSKNDNTIPPLDILNDAMGELQASLMQSLRQGDVISKYSGAQYVVMLPRANFENSTMVMDRVCKLFQQSRRRYSALKLSYTLREIDIAK